MQVCSLRFAIYNKMKILLLARQDIRGWRDENSATFMVICFAEIFNTISGDQIMVENKEGTILGILTELKVKSKNVAIKMWGKKTT